MRKYVVLKKGSKQKITRNFTESEIFSKSIDAPKEYLYSLDVVLAIQKLRDSLTLQFNREIPIVVSGAGRTELHNISVGGTTNSQHLIGPDYFKKGFSSALDIQPKLSDSEYKTLLSDLRTNGKNFKLLRECGINGFGLYNTFIHLDCREQTKNLKHVDDYGRFARWDFTKKKV